MLGALIDNEEKAAEQQSARSSRRRTFEGDFKISLLVLIACIIKADGIRKTSELATVRRILIRVFGDYGTDDAMEILERLLQQDIDET